MARPDFVRQNIKTLFLVVLLLTGSALHTIGQNDPKTRKISFSATATGAEKDQPTEITRPRITPQAATDQAKKVEEKKDETGNTAAVNPNKVLVTSAGTLTQLERQAFDLINEKRKENGLPLIEWSEDMARVGRLHSGNMARFKFFSHIGQDGLMVHDRADLLGFSNWRAIGENIAYNRGYEKPAEFACERWMLSTTHRENILNPRWKEAGIGIAVTADGTYYFTQVFVVR